MVEKEETGFGAERNRGGVPRRRERMRLEADARAVGSVGASLCNEFRACSFLQTAKHVPWPFADIPLVLSPSFAIPF